MPTKKRKGRRRKITVWERIHEYLRQHPEGASKPQIVNDLGINPSTFNGSVYELRAIGVVLTKGQTGRFTYFLAEFVGTYDKVLGYLYMRRRWVSCAEIARSLGLKDRTVAGYLRKMVVNGEVRAERISGRRFSYFLVR